MEKQLAALLVCNAPSPRTAQARVSKAGSACGHGTSVIVWLSFVKASSNLLALYVINLASVLTLHSQVIGCVVCKNSPHCCDSESSKTQETEISSYSKNVSTTTSLFHGFCFSEVREL